MISDNAVGIAPRLSGVADDVARQPAIRINANVNRPQHHFGRQLLLQTVALFLRQILRDLERKDSAIVVMPQDQGVRHAERAAEQFFRGLNFLARISQRLGVGKCERRRKIKRQIVAEFVLRERRAVPIHDLPARRRDVEHVGARRFLRLVRGHDRLLHWRGRSLGRFLRAHGARHQRHQEENAPESGTKF